MEVKIQEYIKNEKYYIIRTNRYKQYLGMSYDLTANNIIFQIFEPKLSNSNYLTPDVNRQFTLKLSEVQSLMKTITMLWNQADKGVPVHNRTLSVRNFGDYNVQVTLTKAENSSEYIVLEKRNKVNLPYESFSLNLGYAPSRCMYVILRRLLKNKDIGGL